MLTYQFKLNVPKETQSLLWKHGNRLNFLYNRFLSERIENHKSRKEDPSIEKVTSVKQSARIPILKKNEEFKDLKEILAQSVQAVLRRLDRAYENFFRRVKRKETAGFPKFRSCRNFFGLLYPQNGYKIKDNTFITKAYGKLTFNKHREIKGKIKQVSIINKKNAFYINIVTDHSCDKNSTSNTTLAIDVGIKYLVVGKDSNGKILRIKNSTHSRYFNKQIDKLKSRRDKLPKKYSREYQRLNRVIQKLSDAEIRKTKDFQHKVSRNLSSHYDTIFVEKLNTKKMSESDFTSLNRNLRRAKLAQFLSFLEYKTFRFVKVNPFNTSKTCNKCGFVHKDLKLSDRFIKCQCGHEYDRDENAAENIFCLGQAILNGCAEGIKINTLIPSENL
jgi:putative transposase